MRHPKLLKIAFNAVFLEIILLFSSCSSGSSDYSDSSRNSDQTNFILDYEFGSYERDPGNSPNNIYVIWAENVYEGFYYPIYVCERLVKGVNGKPLTGTPLPYWKIHKYSGFEDDIDGVTEATQREQDFSVPFSITGGEFREFTVYFETDIGGHGNNWFSDQPAILYKVDIDLDNLKPEHELQFIGWTPDEVCVVSEDNNDNIRDINLERGFLQTDTRYITHHKNFDSTSDAFLGEDNEAQIRGLVGRITVRPAGN